MRDSSRDGWKNKLNTFFLTRFYLFWWLVQKIPIFRRLANKILINQAVSKTKFRPHQFSTRNEFTSWASLTDRTYSGRHLSVAPKHYIESLPNIDEVAEIFLRDSSKPLATGKSSLLFSHFAQWFTDGFLRTVRSDVKRNTSNHEIDLSPLYGLNESQTQILRAGENGFLKSQMLETGEFPPFYFEGTIPKEEFKDLPIYIEGFVAPEKKEKLFAMGVERANNQIGYVMHNVLFLREHNRICRELSKNHSDWDDERLFQTARNINIVQLIKIVIEEYINHIHPYHFQFEVDPSASWKADWYRTNWMTVEFNLLYRWHPLVTDTMQFGDKELPLIETLFNNELLLGKGIAPWFDAASKQKAGAVQLFNTPQFLTRVDRNSIEIGRTLRLRSYNDYRECFSFPRVTSFEQISSSPDVTAALRRLYKDVDNVELYVGLFAEDIRASSVLAPLMGRMVGVDAFSQALTNPLLSEHVYNSKTFGTYGWERINKKISLREIVKENCPEFADSMSVSFDLES